MDRCPINKRFHGESTPKRGRKVKRGAGRKIACGVTAHRHPEGDGYNSGMGQHETPQPLATAFIASPQVLNRVQARDLTRADASTTKRACQLQAGARFLQVAFIAVNSMTPDTLPSESRTGDSTVIHGSSAAGGTVTT